MPTIIIESIRCDFRGEADGGGDDLYIRYYVDAGPAKRYPEGSGAGCTNVAKGETWSVELPITYQYDLRVELYDLDSGTNPDDRLGTNDFTREDASTPQEACFVERDGCYIMRLRPG